MIRKIWITGLAITLVGRRLLADYNNKKIKMFSQDMNIITSLSMQDIPWGIAVTVDKEAVVSVYGETKLFSLDVSDKRMSVRRAYEVVDISTY